MSGANERQVHAGRVGKPKPTMEQQDIDSRLNNWGHCQRGKGGGSMTTRETRRVSSYGGQGYKCMTNVICTMMREAASGPKGSTSVQSQFDFEDAATVNAAWEKVGMRTRLLLRDLYVLERPVNVICREMSIRHWPTSHWRDELTAAKDEIRKMIDRNHYGL